MIRRSIAGLIGITAGLGLMAIPAHAQQLLEPITAQLSAGATYGWVWDPPSTCCGMVAGIPPESYR
jgi:hypothetical protein